MTRQPKATQKAVLTEDHQASKSLQHPKPIPGVRKPVLLAQGSGLLLGRGQLGLAVAEIGLQLLTALRALLHLALQACQGVSAARQACLQLLLTSAEVCVLSIYWFELGRRLCEACDKLACHELLLGGSSCQIVSSITRVLMSA